MTKKLLFMGLLSCTFCSTVRPMQQLGLGLQIPTSFTLRTAFDNVSVPKISQVALGLASIGMFYKACDLWAQASTPFPSNLQGITIQAPIADAIKHGRKMAALKYFLSGSAFATAALLVSYGPTLLKKVWAR